MPAAADPSTSTVTVGRFQVIGTLGQGSQSVVYLAFDPQLHREVAVKSLRLSEDTPDAADMLLNEARAVSRLSHPALVPVFEAGEHGGNPYLVFEYVAGQTLAEQLAEAGAQEPEKVVDLLLPVLDAVEYAHANRVIHRDLKPSNILLDAQGRARVMDFGVAVRFSEGKAATVSDELFGTPAYMAPEYARSGQVSPQMDVFSAGMILYEMICGVRAIQESSGLRAIQRIVHEDIRLPEQTPNPVDERLRAIVQQALARDPKQRYASMQALAEALREWQKTELSTSNGDAADKGGDATALEFLLRRMRLRPDPPALTQAVGEVVRLASSDRQNVTAVAQAILVDAALTQRILRMVNSSMYRGVGGGPVTTASRAILMLGYNAIRSVATSLSLLEKSGDKAQALRLQDEYMLSHFCGVLSREFSGLNERDAEEAFICGTFQCFGRTMATHYFPQDAAEIRRNSLIRPEREELLAQQVLGLGYRDFGVGVARQWGIPDAIVHTMFAHQSDAVQQAPHTRAELLRAICSLSGDLVPVVGLEGPARARLVTAVTQRYAKALSLTERDVNAAIDEALSEVRQLVRDLKLDLTKTDLGMMILGRRQAQEGAAAAEAESPADAKFVARPAAAASPAAAAAARPAAAAGPAPVATTTPKAPAPAAAKTASPEPAVAATASAVPESAPAFDPAQRHDILTGGIQEVASQLVAAFNLNDLLRTVMRTMQRALGFERVILCLREGKTQVLTSRIAVGPGVLPGMTLRLPLDDKADAFALSVRQGEDLVINNTFSVTWADRVPLWHRTSLGSQTVVLLPLHINGTAVGMIYADHALADVLRIGEKDLALMRTLRNQTVLAFRQKAS